MIYFDKSIYSKSAIEKACQDYKGLADINFMENNGKYYCEMRSMKGDCELIKKEFSNYVLNLTVMMGGAKS